MAKNICDRDGSTSAAKKCSFTFTSLLEEPLLKAHVVSIHAYCEPYWNKHFLWLQETDEKRSSLVADLITWQHGIISWIGS